MKVKIQYQWNQQLLIEILLILANQLKLLKSSIVLPVSLKI